MYIAYYTSINEYILVINYVLITLQVLIYIYSFKFSIVYSGINNNNNYNIEGVIDISPLICDIW